MESHPLAFSTAQTILVFKSMLDFLGKGRPMVWFNLQFSFCQEICEFFWIREF